MNNKKTYQKPEVSFVDFTLSTSIAGACRFDATFQQNECTGYIENGWIVYINSECEINPSTPDFCYHVPSADYNVFAS